LNTLLDEGLLKNADPSLRRTPPRIVVDDPSARAVLGYLSGNCGACHNGDGQISAKLPSFAYTDVMDGNSVVRQLVDQPSRWQAPGRSEGTLLIDSLSPQSSAILLRMASRRPSSQMPPLGTVIADREAIDAVARWIAESSGRRLTSRCCRYEILTGRCGCQPCRLFTPRAAVAVPVRRRAHGPANLNSTSDRI